MKDWRNDIKNLDGELLLTIYRSHIVNGCRKEEDKKLLQEVAAEINNRLAAYDKIKSLLPR